MHEAKRLFASNTKTIIYLHILCVFPQTVDNHVWKKRLDFKGLHRLLEKTEERKCVTFVCQYRHVAISSAPTI